MTEPQRYWEKIAEQADAIERLTAENERLRGMLAGTVPYLKDYDMDDIERFNLTAKVEQELRLNQQRTGSGE